MFITFEGGDGTGKTTQINLLKEYLEQRGEQVVISREPGGTPVAEKIRDILLDKNNVMDDVTEAYLYASARAEHVRGVVKPALDAGKTVLCDRYLDSSVAYQGYGRGLTPERVLEINREAVEGVLPDRTYLLVLDKAAAEKRVTERGEKDRMESNGDGFKQRVAEGFLKEAEKNPQRIVVIDAGRGIEDVAADIRADIEKLLAK